jgi:hypothetical protein
VASPYAGILGLTAFATTALRGLIRGEGGSVLFVAWVSLIAFAVAGYAVGFIAEWTIRQSVAQRIMRELDSRSVEDSRPKSETATAA